MKATNKIIDWLLRGDIAIRYQVHRDLLRSPVAETKHLQEQISSAGWGARFLARQKPNGHWGRTFYQPKWTSTHYTLLDLKTIGLSADNEAAQKAVEMVLQQREGQHGGINLAVTVKESDVCLNGMILNYASYFLPSHKRLDTLIDYLLATQMVDGGWNCLYLQTGTRHSSVHSTLNVLEGLLQYRKSKNQYRIKEIREAEKKAIEFLLLHNLYQSHRTGKTIDERFLRLSFPPRWRYDILHCLDYLQDAKATYDPRMQMALNIVVAKRDKNGKWPLQEKHKGAVHFDMEKTGRPSRWNTLRALRVLDHFKLVDDQTLDVIPART